MRLLAYEEGRGAAVGRRALLVFVINGGRTGGFATAEVGGLFTVGDTGEDDAGADDFFIVDEPGSGDDGICVTILLDFRRLPTKRRGLRSG